MSWTDVFPVLDEKMLSSYESEATISEKLEVRKHFSVAEIINQKEDHTNIVSASLFWKPAVNGEEDYPTVTRELMQDPSKFGICSRFENPWEHYVTPLLEGARMLQHIRPDICFRVYLANDLQFLVKELVEIGCEVHLMNSSSIRHNPGAMWRFLAMEDAGLVTITDSDRARFVIHDINRTERMLEGGIGYWRIPYYIGKDDDEYGSPATYRTTCAYQFGSTRSLPMKLLMEAMVWHSTRGTLRTFCKIGESRISVFGNEWPTYGYDEFFLNTAVYPRIAFDGILTFIARQDQCLNHWLALDIEYCTWANPKSEIMYFDQSEEKIEYPKELP